MDKRNLGNIMEQVGRSFINLSQTRIGHVKSIFMANINQARFANDMYHSQNISTSLFTCKVGMLWCEHSRRQKNGVLIENLTIMPRNICHKYIKFVVSFVVLNIKWTKQTTLSHGDNIIIYKSLSCTPW